MSKKGKKYFTGNKLNEMAYSELSQVERDADRVLKPVDVHFTRHFFERLNDPRNRQEISKDELTSFFKNLAKQKDKLLLFLKKYKEFIVKDSKTNINIPFTREVNQIIAKTIMRKADFHSTNPQLVSEIEGEKIRGGLADNLTMLDIAHHHKISFQNLLTKAVEGMKVEREHTINDDIAFEIALDHLYEDLNYYDKIKQIERKSRLVS